MGAPRRLLVIALLVGCAQPRAAPSPPPSAAPVARSKVTTPRPPLVGEATTFLDTEQPNDPADFAWSPDGAELAVEEPGQLVGLWDAATGTRRTAIPVPGAVLSLRFTPDGATLLVVTMRGAAAFRSATGECLRFVAAASRRGAMRAAFGGPGLISTVDANGLVSAVDIATGELRWEVAAGDLATFDPAVTAADRLITRSGSDVAIRRFDTGAIHARVRPPEAGWQAHMSPDGRSAVFVAPDRRAYALADADGGPVRFREVIRGNSAYVSAMTPASARPKPGDGDPAELAEVVFSDDGSTAAVSYDPPNSTWGISGVPRTRGPCNRSAPSTRRARASTIARSSSSLLHRLGRRAVQLKELQHPRDSASHVLEVHIGARALAIEGGVGKRDLWMGDVEPPFDEACRCEVGGGKSMLIAQLAMPGLAIFPKRGRPLAEGAEVGRERGESAAQFAIPCNDD